MEIEMILTFTTEVAILLEEIEVIIQRQNERRLRPKRDANQIVLPSNRRRPNVKRICN